MVREFSHVDEFVRCCEGLGRVLRGAGHKAIIESDRERTADLHVVEGYLSLDAHPEIGSVEAWHRTATKSGRNRSPSRSAI